MEEEEEEEEVKILPVIFHCRQISLRFVCIVSTVDIRTNIAAFNPLNAKLNPISHLLALLRAHLILHVSRLRVSFA